MKLFSALIHLLYLALIGTPLTLTSLLIVTSVNKFPGISEYLFSQRQASRPNASKSEKVWDFDIDKFADFKWCWVKYRA